MDPTDLHRQLLTERLARVEALLWQYFGRGLTEEERARYSQQDGDLSPVPRVAPLPLPTEQQMQEWVEVVLAYPAEARDALAPLLEPIIAAIVTRALETSANGRRNIRSAPKEGDGGGEPERCGS